MFNQRKKSDLIDELCKALLKNFTNSNEDIKIGTNEDKINPIPKFMIWHYTTMIESNDTNANQYLRGLCKIGKKFLNKNIDETEETKLNKIKFFEPYK